MESNNNKVVMSDEQIEKLRMQIALYDYICDMLADLHNCYLTLQPSLPDLPLTLQPSLPDLPLTLHPSLQDLPLTLQPSLPDLPLIIQPSLPDLPLPEVIVENTQQKEPLTLYRSQIGRWISTREQIEILESLFKEGNGIHPNKQETKEITAVLSQHGQVYEASVYNWFQNRRARLKKKMQDQKNPMKMKKVY